MNNVHIDVETIRRSVDLKGLAEAAGATFGENNSSACPLHKGKNPRAFHLYPGGDGTLRWHCFTGCQTGGDVVAFYMRWRRVTFHQALQELADGVGVITTSPAPAAVDPAPPVAAPSSAWQDAALDVVIRAQSALWRSEQRVAALWSERGLVNSTVGLWMLGWWPERTAQLPAGIVIPCWRDGFLWYVKVRRRNGDHGAKYIGLTGGVNTLFGTDHWQGHETLLVTEGEFDCMLAWQIVGHVADVVAVPGASTHLGVEDLAALARYRRIVALYDNDKAGQAGAAYLQQAVGPRVEVATVPGPAKDICEYYQMQGYALNGFLLGLVTGIQEPAPEPSGWQLVPPVANQVTQEKVLMQRYLLNEPELGWRQVA